MTSIQLVRSTSSHESCVYVPPFPGPLRHWLAALGTLCRCLSHHIRLSRLHLPAPLRSPGVTRLHRYYERSDSCVEARQPRPRRSLRRAVPWDPFSFLHHAGLLASRVLSLQSLPSPITPLPPMTALSPNPSASWVSRYTGRGFATRMQARQSVKPNRVCFRYGRLRSPSVALHPASRRRSYGRLQAGVGLPEEDLHLSEQNALASAHPRA